MIPNLKVFDVSNLYEFLYMGMTIKKPQNLPCSDLIQRSKEKTHNFIKQIDLVLLENFYVQNVKKILKTMFQSRFMINI